MIGTLISHIDREIEEYKLLIDVLHLETEAIKRRDFKHILDIVAQKEAVLSRIEKMGTLRRSIIDKAASLHRVSPTISALLNLDVPEKDELYKGVNLLRTLIESSIEINRVNRLAAKASIDNIQKMLHVIKNFMPHSTYNSKGMTEQIELRGSQLREGA